MTDFLSSDDGQYAGLAKKFLEGALTLDAAQGDKGRILFHPTLMLAGHGLELLLKACFYLNGEQPPIKGPKGHDVVRLWATDVCEPVRGHVFANAGRVAEEDRASGAYPDVPKQDDILPLIEEFVIGLGKLHGEAPYPLRYPAEPDTQAPRTPLLVKSLWGASDDFVKRPNDFMVAHFRGNA